MKMLISISEKVCHLSRLNIDNDIANDGIHADGTLTISGGTIITRGPNSDMASAIDTDSTIKTTGGIVIILGYCGSNTVSYSNSYTYSGTCYVYASGSATIK